MVIPVVGECDDSWLDDFRRRWVTTAHVREALAIAHDGPVAEGVVGAGTGMVTMGYKAGIGTSSRVLDGLGTIGVLLLCNFGGRRQMRIGGVPVGELLADEVVAAPTLDTGGSCLGVVMTDLPLDARQLARVARGSGWGWPAWARSRTTAAATSSARSPRPTASIAARRGRTTIDLLGDGSMNDDLPGRGRRHRGGGVQRAVRRRHGAPGVDGNVVPGLPLDRSSPGLPLDHVLGARSTGVPQTDLVDLDRNCSHHRGRRSEQRSAACEADERDH